MAKTHGDIIRESLLAITKCQVELVSLKEDLAYEISRRHALEADIVALRREVAELRTEQVVTARELADFRRRSEVWSQRWWGLAAAATAGLFVALLRRFA